MRPKTAILLCLLFFASIATLTTSLKTIEPKLQESILDLDPLPPIPGPASADPIGGGGGPH